MHATMSGGPSSSSIVLPPRHFHQHSASMSTSQYDQQQISNGHGPPTGPSTHMSPFYGPNFPQQIPISSQQQMAPPPANSFDPRNLEIKTRSVEQTLLPLVQQISTLVNFKESIITGGRPKSERALRAALKIGTAVEAAVERFVAVGETIADENPDIQPELYDACQEARIAGSSIANLHNSMLIDPMMQQQPDMMMAAENGGGAGIPTVDTTQLVRAARQLLSSVTRVLLLADRVLVKHILRAEDKIAYSLAKLEHTSNFSEFVQIFTEFGGQMVDLAHRSGDRQQDLKSEKRRAQMQVARAQLERLTMLLLISSKTLLRHPDDPAARQCRDGVFHQIRTALQLIAVCVTDGVMPFDVAAAYPSPLDEVSRITDGPLDIGIQLTASVAIRQLCEMLDMCRMMSLIGSGVRERLVAALDALCEMSADFTDCAWTSHQQREQILDLLEECRFEMGNLVNSPPPSDIGSGTGAAAAHHQPHDDRLRSESIEVTVERLNRRLKDLRKQLQVVALEQIATVFRQNEDQTILSSLKTCSIAGDIDGVERFLEQFRMHAEHLQEVCRLLHHISLTDALHVFTGHAERNMRALAPLTLLAGRVLCVHPSSRIARENLEVFCDTWATNVNDLARLTKELDAACSGRLAAEKQAYMSLPRPGVSSTSTNSICFSHDATTSPLQCPPITTVQSSPSAVSSSARSSSIANALPISNNVCGGDAVCAVNNGDDRVDVHKQQKFVVPNTLLSDVLLLSSPQQSPLLSLSHLPHHHNSMNPIYSTSYYATIATAVDGTGSPQTMVSAVSSFHAFGFDDQPTQTTPTQTPRPMPRTTSSSSAHGLALKQSSFGMVPPPPAPAPTPEIGRRKAPTLTTQSADHDKELRHAMAMMKKSLAKQQKLQQQQKRAKKQEMCADLKIDDAEEEQMHDDGKQKKANVMSLSAIFRRIRREPKEKKSSKKKKSEKSKSLEKIFERENHSDGEAQQMTRKKMLGKKPNANNAVNGAEMHLMIEEDDDDDADDAQEDWRTFCQSSRSLRVDLLRNAENNNRNFHNTSDIAIKMEMSNIREGTVNEEVNGKFEDDEEDGHHSPLYAQIQKPQNSARKCQQQVDNERPEAVNRNGQQIARVQQNCHLFSPSHPESPKQEQKPKSAFTPYDQFNNLHRQKQQQQEKLPSSYPKSPPRRRKASEPDEEDDEEDAHALGVQEQQHTIIKFNRIGNGIDEPVIMRQQQQTRFAQTHEDSLPSIQDSIQLSSGYGSGSGTKSSSRKSSQEQQQQQNVDVPTMIPMPNDDDDDDDDDEHKNTGNGDGQRRAKNEDGNGNHRVDESASQDGVSPTSHYATVLIGRAPLAKCDEIEEEEEMDDQNDEFGFEEMDCIQRGGGRRNGGGNSQFPNGIWSSKTTTSNLMDNGNETCKKGEEDFVVRMRAKKSARLASVAVNQPNINPGAASNNSRFEQRISQILESLQAEAESLIRLEQQHPTTTNTRNGYSRRFRAVASSADGEGDHQPLR